MKKFNYSVIFVALIGFAAFTSCDRNNATPEETGQVAVKFTGDVANMSKTRAYDQTWEVGDRIAIFMVDEDNDGNLSTIGSAANNPFGFENAEAAAAGNFTAVADNHRIFYPTDGRDVNFITYYPFRSGQAFGDYVITIPADQNPKEAEGDNPASRGPADIDLLYASAFSDGSIHYNKEDQTPVTFTFEHKLAKIVFNILDPESTGVETDVTRRDIGMMEVTLLDDWYTTATFDLITGELNDDQDDLGSSITRKTVEIGDENDIFSAVFDAIIIPNNYDDDLQVQFSIIDGETTRYDYTATIPATNFESGKVYTYNVTIHRDFVIIQSSTITNWVAGDQTEDELIAE